jgi:hypothetical protein
MRPVTKHRLDGLSLVFGTIFLLTALWWLVGGSFSVPLPGLGWVVAAGLILFGALGLASALRSGRRKSEDEWS